MTATKKKTIYVEPIEEAQLSSDLTKLNLPGWEFSWQSLLTNGKRGWGIHRPVQKDTELGALVMEQFGILGNTFAGLQADNNLFYKGPDLVLAYTSTELFEKAMAAKQTRADRQMAEVGENAKVQMRHANISKGVKSGPHTES